VSEYALTPGPNALIDAALLKAAVGVNTFEEIAKLFG
jgi:hypothetical protein